MDNLGRRARGAVTLKTMAALTKHKITVEEYERMGESGVFGPDVRLELIDGEIVEMTPIGSQHAACVERLVDLLKERLARRAQVRSQNPVRIGRHSEPQPDILIVTPRPDYYAAGHPGAPDTHLVIEVSDSSSATDRDVKVPLYRAGEVREVWIVNLGAARIETFLAGSDGSTVTRAYQRGESLAPAAFPDVVLRVDEILD